MSDDDEDDDSPSERLGETCTCGQRDYLEAEVARLNEVLRLKYDDVLPEAARIAELEAALLTEREACAKIAERTALSGLLLPEGVETAHAISAAIRARPAP